MWPRRMRCCQPRSKAGATAQLAQNVVPLVDGFDARQHQLAELCGHAQPFRAAATPEWLVGRGATAAVG